MSNSYHYRIDSPEVLQKIDAFFEKIRNFDNQVLKLCEAHGVKNYSSYDSILAGKGFNYLIAKKDHEVDLNCFRVLKHKDSAFKILKPKKSNKEFSKVFDAMVPEPITYHELSEILLKQPNGLISYGYKHKPGQPFYFYTSHSVHDYATEVLASEYRNAFSDKDASKDE